MSSDKLNIALLIVSNSKTFELEKLLFNTINSSISSCVNTKINLSIYCSEKARDVVDNVCKAEFPVSIYCEVQTEPFNYNRILNDLAQKAEKEVEPSYFIFANSDLYFHGDCIPRMIAKMEENQIHSASPYDPWVHAFEHFIMSNDALIEGYEVRYHISGWCIFTSSIAYKAIGKLNEDVAFWYSDNIYADQLKKALIPHVLVTSAICEHLGSQTLEMASSNTYSNLTSGELSNYTNARAKMGAKTPVLNFKNELSYASWMQTNIQILEMTSCALLKKFENNLFELLIRRFAYFNELSLVDILYFLNLTKKKWSTKQYNFFWKTLIKRFGKEKRWFARIIKISLIIYKK